MMSLRDIESLPKPGAALGRDDVHVWRASLDPPAPRLWQLARLLSEDERCRAERFCFERDRDRFIAGRGLLRTILARYLDIAPERLRFRYGAGGKPVLADAAVPLRFNLSHAGRLVLYALAWGREIGVDLEHIRPDVAAELIAERHFSPWENAQLRSLPAGERAEGFFNCWTRKEAYVKARGEGLALPLNGFDVSLASGEPARLLRVQNDPREASRWRLHTWRPAPGYVAALAVEGDGWRLTCREWTHMNDPRPG